MGCACAISTDISTDEYKPKGLELAAKANVTHIFRLEIPFGNFVLLLLLKTAVFPKLPFWGN